MNRFTWGWITSDGVRCKANGETTATPEKIIGIWGKHGKTYHETFLKECLPEEGTVNNWNIRPLATLLDINKERTYRFVKKKKLLINKIVGAPEPDAEKRILQKWQCKCGHSFYTSLAKMPCIIKRIWSMLFTKTIECQSCHTKTAKNSDIIKKDIRVS